ncbi:hypothetical protein B0J14DRAFT_573639 [Halenospora varia]|nr:hypothetical protein B0J14DRAFT_573639 [Halenospora varia]
MSEPESPTSADKTKCKLCQKSYSTRSSYLRHAKVCGTGIANGPPRQKSCRQCVKAKTRCDQRHPSCSRCASQNRICEYTHGSNRSERQVPEVVLNSRPLVEPTLGFLTKGPSICSQDIAVFPVRPHDPDAPIASGHPGTPESLDKPSPAASSSFCDQTDPSLLTITATPTLNGPTSNLSHQSHDINAIRDRWLYPYVEGSPAQHAVVGHSVFFLCRVLRTYPRMMARRGISRCLPPMIHPHQVIEGQTPLPLANCFTLTRMWKDAGETGWALVEETIKREMERLFHEYHNYPADTLVAAFQALLIYSIILLFPFPQKPSPGIFNQITLVTLQDVAHQVSQTSLMLEEEESLERPTWTRWAFISAKRRTLMCLYLFEWIYSKLNNLPTYPCTELGFMPVPFDKFLWAARTENEFELEYGYHLSRWGKGDFYREGELASVRPGSELPERTEMFLEDVDEFGMMFMALVNASEGEISGGVEDHASLEQDVEMDGIANNQ